MRVVFVEDDVVIRALVGEFLREQGHVVDEATTAEDAMLRMVGASAPQVVVTDIDLGAGRSGLEFADWLHARWPELHVIFVSGRLDRLKDRTRDPHETCLAKPFRLHRLVELLLGVSAPST